MWFLLKESIGDFVRSFLKMVVRKEFMENIMELFLVKDNCGNISDVWGQYQYQEYQWFFDKKICSLLSS